MIEIYHTGGGCMAYHVQEPDAPGLYALITAPDGAALPENPEFDPMMIGVYREESSDNMGLTTLAGRLSLIEWYEEHVGYSPDEDISGQTPILELMDRVASHLLLRAHAEKAPV